MPLEPSDIKIISSSEFADLIGEPLQSDDLHVHIKETFFDSIPITTPFKSLNYDIIIITSGMLNLKADISNYTLQKNEALILKPKTTVQILEISNDLKVIGISFSNTFIFDVFFNKTNIDAFDFFTMNQIPKLQLKPNETNHFKTYAKLLKSYNSNQENGLFKTEIIKNLFSLIIYSYAEIFKNTHPNLKIELNRQEEIAYRFWNILQENVKVERTVEFYADALNVTAGYLSKVLKVVANKNASQIIDEAVILEARLLLENPQFSIAQISEELHFSNQSFFGKYFKKHTGFSPSYYRKNYSK